MYQEQIARLRSLENVLRRGGFFALARIAQDAANTMENQQREIDALKRIIEKQAGLNQKLADMALELDQVKVERDAAIQAVCSKCHKKPDMLPVGAKCGETRCPWWRGPQKEE